MPPELGADDLYAVLGVDSSVKADALRPAYLRACRDTHPDKQGGSEEAFERVQKAWSVLSDPEERAAYDDRREAWLERRAARADKDAAGPGVSQRGVVPGVHIKVHGQQNGPGGAPKEREVSEAERVAAAQLEVAPLTEEEWLAEGAERADAARRAGTAAFRAGDFAAAAERYTEAVRFVASGGRPRFDVATLYSNRSAAFAAVGRHARALADAEEAVSHKPGWAKAHLRRGVACEGLKHHQEAADAYAAAERLAGDDPTREEAAAGRERAAAAARAAVERSGGEVEATIAEVRHTLEQRL